MLNFPYWTIPITVHTDVNDKHFGDVISLNNKPISFFLSILINSQHNYTTRCSSQFFSQFNCKLKIDFLLTQHIIDKNEKPAPLFSAQGIGGSGGSKSPKVRVIYAFILLGVLFLSTAMTTKIPAIQCHCCINGRRVSNIWRSKVRLYFE